MNGLIQTIYENWHNYQRLLIDALRPLTVGQLALRASPQLRTIDEIARHIVGCRARWFYKQMEEHHPAFELWLTWDRDNIPVESAAQVIDALENTWQVMQETIDAWSADDWQQTWPNHRSAEPEIYTRQWIIWHLIEHDLHHGGEISLTLGANGLPGIDI